MDFDKKFKKDWEEAGRAYDVATSFAGKFPDEHMGFMQGYYMAKKKYSHSESFTITDFAQVLGKSFIVVIVVYVTMFLTSLAILGMKG